MKKKTVLLILFCLSILPVFAEFNNLNEYFQYLPNAVHKNWVPYESNSDYEIAVQFSVKRNGEITEPTIVKSTNKKAEAAVINAVKKGVPYAPLPKKYTAQSVKAQIELQYRAKVKN